MKLPFDVICERITRIVLFAALCFVPIFVVPFTLHPATLNKQTLFFVLMAVGSVAWLMRAAYRRKIDYSRGMAMPLLLSVVLFSAVSAFFSRAMWVGIMGVGGGETGVVINIVSFTLFYFLISIVLRSKEDLRSGAIALMAGATPLLIAALPAMVGSLFALVGYPVTWWDFVNTNFVGTTNAFALYAGIIAALSHGMRRHGLLSGIFTIWAATLEGVALALVFLVGYWPAFLLLLVAYGIAVLSDARANRKGWWRRNAFALGVVDVCVVFFIAGITAISLPVPRIASAPEVAPSIGASFRIAKATARESVGRFLLGSGPATYSYQYARYREPSLNATPFWSVRFTQGFNALFTHLVEWGIFGTLLFVAFLLLIAFHAARLLLVHKTDAVLSIFGGLYISAVLTLFLYPQNFSLYVLLFAFAGAVSAGMAREKQRQVSHGIYRYAAGAGIAALCFLLYVASARYVAAIAFSRGFAASQSTEGIERALSLFKRAVSLDSRNDSYLQGIASAYLAHANTIAEQSGGKPSSEIQKDISTSLTSAVSSAERSTQVNPLNVENWVGLGQVYATVAPFNEGAATSIAPAYATAQALDPANPAILLYAGNAHRAAGDRGQSGADAEYAAALAAYEAAIRLKPDYASAYFAIIGMFDAAKKEADAVARADRLLSVTPNDAEIALQVGIIHYQKGRIGKARAAFEAAVRIIPDYANALYFLGVAYDREGNRSLALEQFERVLALNPDSVEVQAAIANVRAGKPALGNPDASKK